MHRSDLVQARFRELRERIGGPRCTRRTRRKFQSVFSAAAADSATVMQISSGEGRKGDRNEIGFGEEIVRMQEEIDDRAGGRETGVRVKVEIEVVFSSPLLAGFASPSIHPSFTPSIDGVIRLTGCATSSNSGVKVSEFLPLPHHPKPSQAKPVSPTPSPSPSSFGPSSPRPIS